MVKKWQVKVLKDGNDLFLPIPDEVLRILGVAEGDSLYLEKRDNGTYQLSKAHMLEKDDNRTQKHQE